MSSVSRARVRHVASIALVVVLTLFISGAIWRGLS